MSILTNEQITTLLGGDMPPDYALNSVYEIENVLLMLKQITKQIDWFKDLKKYRTQSINEKINELEDKAERLRGVVLGTMKKLEPDHTTLNFPSIGAVTRKKNPGKWNIEDEEALIEFLGKAGYADQVVKTTTRLDNRQLKKVLDDMSDARVDVPGVSYVEGKESISIKYEDKPAKQVAADNGTGEVIEQVDNILDTLDNISVDDV